MNENYNHANLNLVELADTNSKIVFDLQGGTLLSWRIKDNRETVVAVESLNQLENEISQDQDSWKEVLYQGSSSKRTGIPILFPFANPLKNDILDISGGKIGQHGFARNCLWQLDKIENGKVIIKLCEADLPKEIQTAYPFEFEVKIIVNISKANKLIYKLEVTNLGQVNMPIAPGVHPYFPVKHDSKNQLLIFNNLENISGKPVKSEKILFDGESVDWNQPSNGYFNDFESQAMIDFGDDRAISIQETSGSPDFQNLVIWSQDTQEIDYNFVCVEPFTRKTNAINDNPILIKPGTTWTVTLEFAVVS